jgi:acetyltransferase-like isoleucine patch superfamily enzyme
MNLRTFLITSDKSWVKKYQLYFIGTEKIGDLVKYELILSLFGSFPGAVGLFLRKFFFKFLFKKVGNNVIFGKNITIRHSTRISLGDSVIIEDNAVLDAKGFGHSQIVINEEVTISRNAIIRTKGSLLNIGSHSNIGANCIIASNQNSPVSIGENVLVAAYCYIIGGGNYSYDKLDVPIMDQGMISKGGIVIEDNVWLGAGVKILDGVRIGTGSIIGTGSVVTRDIPEFSVAFGFPAKVVKKRTLKAV